MHALRNMKVIVIYFKHIHFHSKLKVESGSHVVEPKCGKSPLIAKASFQILIYTCEKSATS